MDWLYTCFIGCILLHKAVFLLGASYEVGTSLPCFGTSYEVGTCIPCFRLSADKFLAWYGCIIIISYDCYAITSTVTGTIELIYFAGFVDTSLLYQSLSALLFSCFHLIWITCLGNRIGITDGSKWYFEVLLYHSTYGSYVGMTKGVLLKLPKSLVIIIMCAWFYLLSGILLISKSILNICGPKKNQPTKFIPGITGKWGSLLGFQPEIDRLCHIETFGFQPKSLVLDFMNHLSEGVHTYIIINIGTRRCFLRMLFKVNISSWWISLENVPTIRGSTLFSTFSNLLCHDFLQWTREGLYTSISLTFYNL